jgi:hypothetical protein
MSIPNQPFSAAPAEEVQRHFLLSAVTAGQIPEKRHSGRLAAGWIQSKLNGNPD